MKICVFQHLLYIKSENFGELSTLFRYVCDKDRHRPSMSRTSMKNDMTNHTFSYYRIPFYAFIDFYNDKTVCIIQSSCYYQVEAILCTCDDIMQLDSTSISEIDNFTVSP
jgi:hypothetical protein